MQRKRTRGYYSDTVELGTSILPMRQMKKFTMSKLLKYFCLIALGFCIYSMYEKVMDASKASEKTDGSNENLVENRQQQLDDDNGVIDKAEDVRDRHVKEHINKVFEEFKQEQDNKNKLENQKDVFQDYVDNIEKNNDDEVIHVGLDDTVDSNGEQDNTDKNDDDEFDESVNDDNFDGNAAIDDNTTVEEDDVDEEIEREELKEEREIEERIAGAFQDAHQEVKEEDQGLGQDEGENNKDNNINAQLEKDELGVAQNMGVPDEQYVLEKKEYKRAVDKVGRRLSPQEMRYLKEKAARLVRMDDQDHEFPPFITAARQTTFAAVKQLIASIQIQAPGKMMYIYSLDLSKEERDELATYCNVRVRIFMIKLFPKHVSDLDNLHWKPLVMQVALSEYGHMIWVNPGFRLASQELAPLVHESHDNGILILGQAASYSTYAATHPDMLKFMPVDNEKLAINPHIEIRAIFIHNSDEVHDNFMKMFTSCGLEENCLAPIGSKWHCTFDLTGRKRAGCHRYDESAINILVKNWFDFDMDKFARRNQYFKKVDRFIKTKPKVCRKIEDARNFDL